MDAPETPGRLHVDESGAEQRQSPEKAREAGIRRFVDCSRSNPLLFYPPLHLGTLELTRVPAALETLLSGRELRAADLVVAPEITEAGNAIEDEASRRVRQAEAQQKVRRSLFAIRREAWRNLEEEGLETLYLAVGAATWPAEDGGRPYEAPVLLIPAQLKCTGRKGKDLELALSGEPQANLVLLQVLEDEYGILVDPELLIAAGTLVAAGKQREATEWSIEVEATYEYLHQAMAQLERSEIQRRIILGNFSCPKLAVVRHRERQGEQAALDTDSGQQPELVRKMLNGRVARPKGATSLHDALTKVIDDLPAAFRYPRMAPRSFQASRSEGKT